ncbi:TPA: UDP-N-acetylglucosamine 2-epimerase (hydrolyzing), partial [Vibrio vulnificus]|nr:UDP-N-acetylglucosamine 2-epimerase (hydrolyzing) [Vibrio vulnificus]
MSENQKKVAVFTGTRAEYGLLFWLLKDIQADPELQLQLLVSGMHLSPEFGETYQQIERDGFHIDEKIEILLSSDSAVGTAKSMGLGVLGFADALARLNPDVLVILGDRFEALAAAQTAMILRIPVIHLHGGEITEGAYDDAIRHAITKLSYLHGTSTEAYRQRVIQLGEAPERVKNIGAIGLDHLKRAQFMDVPALAQSLYFPLTQPYFLV